MVRSRVRRRFRAQTSFLRCFKDGLSLTFDRAIFRVLRPVKRFASIRNERLNSILAVSSGIRDLAIRPLSLAVKAHRHLKRLFRPFLHHDQVIVVPHRLSVFRRSFVGRVVVDNYARRLNLSARPFIQAVGSFVRRILKWVLCEDPRHGIVLLRRDFCLPRGRAILMFSRERCHAIVGERAAIKGRLIRVCRTSVAWSLTAQANSLE